MSIRKIFCVGAFLFLAACGKETGDEFVGTWKQTGGRDNIEVKRNSDSFLVTDITYYAVSKDNFEEFRNSTAGIAKDGGLEVSGDYGKFLYVIDKKSGHLVGNGHEYQKLN